MTIKQTLKPFVEYALVRLKCQKQRKRQKRSHSPRSSLKIGIVTPSTCGSLGDYAMVEGLKAELKREGFGDVRLCNWGKNPDSEHWTDQPFGIFPAEFNKWDSFIEGLSQLDWCFVIGADVLDGKYSFEWSYRRILTAIAAGHLCNGATITGFSFRANAQPALKQLLKIASNRVGLMIRDSHSRDRLASLKTTLVSDLAFLMPPESTPKNSPLIKEITALKESGKTIAGLNLSRLALDNNPDKLPASEMTGKLIPPLEEFMNNHPDTKLLMLYHDTRGGADSDYAILDKVRSLLPEEMHSRIIQCPEGFNAGEVKQVAGLCDYLLTGRKHLAIGALSQGVPVIAFDYQGKFTGLFSRFGTQHLILRAGSPNWLEDLKTTLESVAKERTILSDQIRKQVEFEMKHVRNNIADLLKFSKGHRQ